MKAPTGTEIVKKLASKWTARLDELKSKSKLSSNELAELIELRSKLSVLLVRGRV
jgi:hypothetical protein